MKAFTEYDMNEISRYHKEVQEKEKAPLADRKEAAAKWAEAMRDYPDLISERIGWLLEGCYGRGAQIKALQVLEAKRMNRVAALSVMIACCEWMCPARLSVEEWKKLNVLQQKTLKDLIAATIAAKEAEEAEESE